MSTDPDLPSPKILKDVPVIKELTTSKRRALAALDLTFLDDWMDNGPGRNPKYDRSSMLKGLLLCVADNIFNYRAIRDRLKTYPARRICGFTDDTPRLSTVWEFWGSVQPHLQAVFDRLAQLLDQLGIYGDTFALDSTDLPCSEDDPDGAWGWDDIEDEPYYGYGLLTAVDCATDLPGSAVVCQRKQHPETKTLECLGHLTTNTDVTQLLGDAWFDTLEYHYDCLDRDIRPISTFNPRNTGEDYDYRIEKLVDQGEADPGWIEDDDLDDEFSSRLAAERFHTVLKEDDQRLDFRSHGRDRVETHIYLVLIDRLLTGLGKWMDNPSANLRSIR